MKLETLKEKVDIIKGDDVGDQTYGIDGANMHLAIQAFYQYSNPIGSIIREITSNAYDAHIEADVDDKPVILRFDHNEMNMTITDFGVGLSPDRVRDVFTKFFSSTKRDSNSQIGAFGLGSKSPLSYTDMFQVTTKYGLTVYEYVIHKADGVPSLVTLDEHAWKPDTWPWHQSENGTRVSIPMQKSDFSQFIRSARKQLAYFDNVFIDDPDCKDYNQEQIFKGRGFIYRNSDKPARHGLDQLHMCVGKVYYPLNNIYSHITNMSYSELEEIIKQAVANMSGFKNLIKAGPYIRQLKDGANPSQFNSNNKKVLDHLTSLPMALYFDIGELPILWHRENIEYTKKAWKTICVRAYEALIEMKVRQKEEIGDVYSLKDAAIASSFTKGSSEKVYMHRDALDATFSEVRLSDLETQLTVEKGSIDKARPYRFVEMLYEQHSDSKGVPYEDLIEVMFKSNKRNLQIYRIEKGEARKSYLTGYMESKGYDKLVIPRRGVDSVMKRLGLTLPDSRKVVETYVAEFYTAFDQLPEANEIVIPEMYKKKDISSRVSEIPALVRRFDSGHNVQYMRVDLKDILDPNKRSWRALKPPSLFVYGFQDDRDMLNIACSNNRGSLFREKFTYHQTNTYDCTAYLGVISKETGQYIGDVIPSVYVYDFVHHRRFLANLCTRHMLGLYEQKFPWFRQMMKDYAEKSTAWYTLQNEHQCISKEELKKIQSITLSGYVYNKEHNLWPYIAHGLKKRFIHFDELEAYKWAHGMYAKYARLLSSDWIKTDLNSRPNAYYYAEQNERVPHNINPLLYRKHHVRNIET